MLKNNIFYNPYFYSSKKIKQFFIEINDLDFVLKMVL